MATWAAYSEMKQGNKTMSQPVGPSCENCYRKAIHLLGYATYSDFLKAWEDDDDNIQATFATIDEREKEPEKAPSWQIHSVEKACEFEVEVSKVMRGYTETSLKKKLNLTRLTHRATHQVPEILGPSLSHPGKSIPYYLFKALREYPEDDDGLDVKLTGRCKYVHGTEVLSAMGNLYEEHANDQYRRNASSDEALSGAQQTFTARNFATLPEFLEEWSAAQRTRAAKPSTPTKSGAVTGAAGDELEVKPASNAGSDDDEEHMHKDLTLDQVNQERSAKKLRRLSSGIVAESKSEADEGDEEDVDSTDEQCTGATEQTNLGEIPKHGFNEQFPEHLNVFALVSSTPSHLMVPKPSCHPHPIAPPVQEIGWPTGSRSSH